MLLGRKGEMIPLIFKIDLKFDMGIIIFVFLDTEFEFTRIFTSEPPRCTSGKRRIMIYHIFKIYSGFHIDISILVFCAGDFKCTELLVLDSS